MQSIILSYIRHDWIYKNFVIGEFVLKDLCYFLSFKSRLNNYNFNK